MIWPLRSLDKRPKAHSHPKRSVRRRRSSAVRPGRRPPDLSLLDPRTQRLAADPSWIATRVITPWRSPAVLSDHLPDHADCSLTKFTWVTTLSGDVLLRHRAPSFQEMELHQTQGDSVISGGEFTEFGTVRPRVQIPGPRPFRPYQSSAVT